MRWRVVRFSQRSVAARNCFTQHPVHSRRIQFVGRHVSEETLTTGSTQFTEGARQQQIRTGIVQQQLQLRRSQFGLARFSSVMLLAELLANIFSYFITNRYRRRTDRSYRSRELPSYGTGQNWTKGVGTSSGPVFQHRHPYTQALPYAGGWRTVDAISLHG